ncbi:MAG TPA: chalcone isomerase family protein, partial [Gammaproteobacteria bacterium]
RDAAAVLDQPGAKRMSLQFVYKEIRAEKLVSAWNEGFERNLPPNQFRALRPRIANFNGLFPTLRQGDRVDIDFLPRADKGAVTQVWINGVLRGKVRGADFARALLQIWLGDYPVDADLKQALLGGG